jgi:hypothetical protein
MAEATALAGKHQLRALPFNPARLKGLSREGCRGPAKFEMEDGKLQLSVYTAKGSDYSEVIVDHRTGKVANDKPITGGDDLTAAKAQAEAKSVTEPLD